MSLINNLNNQVATRTSSQKSFAKQQHQLTRHYTCVDTVYNTEFRALWCTFRSAKNPVFSLEFLKNIRDMQDNVAQFSHDYPAKKPLYLIWASDNPHIFSLGLDLKYVHDLISKKDEIGLYKYLELCIDILYINIMKFDIKPLITISLIKGKTFGGGFEAALTSDVIIASENIRCGFPGIRYNLLPSIGLMNVLMQRYPKNIIEPLLLGNKAWLNSKELLQCGIVEKIVKDTDGHQAVHEKIRDLHEKHDIYAAIYHAKALSMQVKQQDLEEFKNLWVRSALNFKPDDLYKLGRIAEAQKLLSERALNKVLK